MIIEDIVFKNMWGTTSKKYDPKVGTLVCSDKSVSFGSFGAFQVVMTSNLCFFFFFLEMHQYPGS
jgi:hypothetical protein